MLYFIVGGYWSKQDGKESAYINKFAMYIKLKSKAETIVFNGGNDIKQVYEKLKLYYAYQRKLVVIWLANVAEEAGDIKYVQFIKREMPLCLLVTSKRNNNEYSINELLQHALALKSNLFITFTKTPQADACRADVFATLLDPLGNQFIATSDVRQLVTALLNRLTKLKNYTRKGSMQILNHNTLALNCTEEMYDFNQLIQKYAEVYHNIIYGVEKIERFLGNASFRCTFGMPSMRITEGIYVSPRNVNKNQLKISDFVKVTEADDIDAPFIYYYGSAKPSVDAPIQLRLYKLFPELNFMLHAHVYIKDAPFTSEVIPCGSMEEVNEIIDIIRNKTLPCFVNLKGHGSIALANKVSELKNIEYYARPIPEEV